MSDDREENRRNVRMIEEMEIDQWEATADGYETAQGPAKSPTSTSIDWYSAGQSRTVECDGVRLTVRFVGRKGRRGRIVIEAPAGAVFRSDRK